MAREFVHEIRLQDVYGKWHDLMVNDHITLPDNLYVNSTYSYAGYYKLDRRHARPGIVLGVPSITAMYIHAGTWAHSPSPHSGWIDLDYVLRPIQFGLNSILPGSPTYQNVTVDPAMVAGLSILTDSTATAENPWGRSPPVSTPLPNMKEPECRCDMRVLMSSGHEAGCSWKAWKDAR